MARLRVVKTGEGGVIEERGFADAARAALEEALADGAVALTVLWEAPGKVSWRSIPNSRALTKGLIGFASDALFSEDVEEDDS